MYQSSASGSASNRRGSAVVAQSTNVYLMRVESVDREKKVIIYRKVQDIKGKHPQDIIRHNFSNAGLRPDEWKKPLDWAEPGKLLHADFSVGSLPVQ